MVDTHCHLDLAQFDDDREAVIARGEAVGVGRLINPAIDLDSCRRVLELAACHRGVYAAVGVHPNDCADFENTTVARLRELAGHPKVVAIGEIGLDYYRNRAPRNQQRHALHAQWELAAELGLPVILHSRNASLSDRSCITDLLDEAEQMRPAIRKRLGQGAIIGVWHAFAGDLAEAEQAYDLGLVLGLGGAITFQNARRLRDLVPRLRSDRLVLETDAPYLAPHPHRGQRNEPQYVPLVASRLAELCCTTAEAIGAQTTATAEACFRRMT